MDNAKMVSIENVLPDSKSGWRVVGVDPAPKKPSTICYFDGKSLVFAALKAHELLNFMNDLKSEQNILITWDAPLTGPPTLKHGSEEHAECYFYYRWIEHFLSKNGTFKPPTGISTLGYAGCPHWAITKAATGLPILGPYCSRSKDLPFHHVVSDKDKLSDQKASIIEVHPALAMYHWLKDVEELKIRENWKYKNLSKIQEKGVCELYYKNLKSELNNQLKPITLPGKIDDADELDAFVAWALGYLYVMQPEGQQKARILGNQETGSMLLPWDEDIFSGFDAFLKSNDVALASIIQKLNIQKGAK
jgi:hypothetical protein